MGWQRRLCPSILLCGCAGLPDVDALPEPPSALPVLTTSTPPITITPPTQINLPKPAYALLESRPINLPTVLRLVDANSPAIAAAQARIRQAEARLDRAEKLWLPTLSVGAIYSHFDGQTQNQRGEVFGASRGNLFSGAGLSFSFDVAEAIYRPLVESRNLTAAQQLGQSETLHSELEAVLAYFELEQVYGQLAINAVTIELAESMLKAAMNARTAKLDRSAGDVQRAQTEVYFRHQERIDLRGRAGAASARLGRLLRLPPTIRLEPLEKEILPITLIDRNCTLEQLVEIGIANNPYLAAQRAGIASAWERLRLAKRTPLIPKVALQNLVGSFGGGLNNDLQDFEARNALSAQLYWELKNLGAGNRADQREARAFFDQTQYEYIAALANYSAEVVETSQTAAARAESLEFAEKAYREAQETYRIAKEGTLNVVDAKNLFDALRPLQAIQTMNQARTAYLNAIIDYNRAQYRLFTTLGYPPDVAQSRGEPNP